MNVAFSLVVFAQQAYNNGRAVSRIVGYVLVAAVVVWVLGKVFRR